MEAAEKLKMAMANGDLSMAKKKERKEKASGAGNKSARERERATKGAYSVEQRAKSSAEREIKSGKMKAGMTEEELNLSAEEKAAVDKITRAQAEKHQAALQFIKDGAIIGSKKEVAQKKMLAMKKEIKQKKEAASADQEVTRKLAAKRAEDA